QLSHVHPGMGPPFGLDLDDLALGRVGFPPSGLARQHEAQFVPIANHIVAAAPLRIARFYSFKHALVQEVAYENLLKSRRQVLHQRIAQALEKEFPETAKTEPELLALHYAGAGLADPAISYWQTAAERALQRSANVEAANHFRQALALLAT